MLFFFIQQHNFDAILGLQTKVTVMETKLEDIQEQNCQTSTMMANIAKAVLLHSEDMKEGGETGGS